jgi:hypothetical protein
VKEEAQGKAREMGSALTAPPRATWQVIQGDAVERLRALPDESVQTCVTSPPYFGLRDYGVEGQIGLELPPTSTWPGWSRCSARSGGCCAMTGPFG